MCIRDSKSHAEAFKVPHRQENQFEASIYNDKPNDLESLLNKIRRKVKEQRIRVSEFLRDFDKLRCGGITVPQFRLGLNMAKIPLSNDEFKMLVTSFPFESRENFVSWRVFCEAIDEVFTTCLLYTSPSPRDS
eukprot:TRINITY_DN20851_c0_g1_i1.p2 TRINITY_DN20851_c0_g1~~TRINITY_DN20851_c0_g1_i1.p2  ORF type:complete len:133 (+),score=37.28 TRINITY_DN20851_c0_g1_i1:60-458(+)